MLLKILITKHRELEEPQRKRKREKTKMRVELGEKTTAFAVLLPTSTSASMVVRDREGDRALKGWS